MQGNPFREIQEIMDRMGRQVDEGMARTGMKEAPADLEDRGDEYVASIELPGFSPDDIDLTVQDDRLRLQANREETTRETGEGGRFVRQERSTGTVTRTIRLPDEVEEEGVNATYRNGVLTVTLPKRTQMGEDARQIEIS